ncbi:MAG: hypothetical protein KME26_05505 [Oscillatoria princeps RMCB-10]|jgi:hypothetical protein|nr:hypothetical protein [Oscillatoria princeps RMCB-10]
MQRSRNECENDFSRRQEKNIFGQLNPGNGIETWDAVCRSRSPTETALPANRQQDMFLEVCWAQRDRCQLRLQPVAINPG